MIPTSIHNIMIHMKNLLILAFPALFLASCGSGEYRDITYTNNYGEAIEFKTVEKDSPAYKLEAGESTTLASDVPGRTEIRTINQRLATWEYKNNDVYEIQFIKRKSYTVEIINFASYGVTITEKNNYLEVEKNGTIEGQIAVPGAGVSEGSGDGEVSLGRASASIYTNKPVFVFMNTSEIKFKLRRCHDSKTQNDGGNCEICRKPKKDLDNAFFILGIDPPSGEWWKK